MKPNDRRLRFGAFLLALLPFAHASAQQAAGIAQPVAKSDPATTSDVIKLSGAKGGFVSGAFFQQGERVVTGSSDNIARVWDARTGKELFQLKDTGFNGCYVSASSDGETILTTNTPYVKLWDGKTGQELMDLTDDVGLKSHWPFPFLGTVSPDGRKLITCACPKGGLQTIFKLNIRDSETGKVLSTMKGQDYWTNCSAFSHDGARVATGSETIDDVARVWETETGTELFAFGGNGGSVWSVCFSPDDRMLAIGGQDGNIRLQDLTTGNEVRTLKGLSRVVTSVSFSPDGKWLLAGSQDNTVRMWDVDSGLEIAVLQRHTSIVSAVQFSPDGRHILTASRDNTAFIMDVESLTKTTP